MKIFLLFILILSIHAKFDLTLSDEELFKQFKAKYNKVYETTEEENYRYGIFQSNLKHIREKNSQRKHEWEATFGINSKTDTLPEERKRNPLKQHLKGDIPEGNPSIGVDFWFNKDYYQPPPLPTGDNLPENLFYCSSLVSKNTDRPKIDFCGTPFDQGTCGCCYAAVLANLGQYVYANLTYNYNNKDTTKIEKINLSPQRMMDSTKSTRNKRCCGGNSVEAMYFTQSFSKIDDYPFVDKNGKEGVLCTPRGDQNPDVPVVMNIYNYHMFATSGLSTHQQQVLALKKILHHYGPFVTSIHTKSDDDFDSYSEGIYEFPSTCNPSATDHAIMVVGYGKESGQEYFLIRNSWGDWGFEEKGYMKISPKYFCGIGYIEPKVNGHYGTLPSNVIAFVGSCALDKNCEQCDRTTMRCLKCKNNKDKDVNGMCLGDPDNNNNNGGNTDNNNGGNTDNNNNNNGGNTDNNNNNNNNGGGNNTNTNESSSTNKLYLFFIFILFFLI